MLIAVAALLHAALLGAVDGPAATSHASAPTVRALDTRIVVPTVEPVSALLATDEPPVAPRAAVRERRVVAPRPAAPNFATESVVDTSVAAESTSPVDPPRLLAQADAVPAASAAASSTPPTAGDTPIPHYRTQMPNAATLRYQLARGMLHGTGELQWKPDGDRYEARLEGKLGSMTLLTQISSGGFDADGIAPLRFTDWRVRRSTVAANFQRPAGKVTFSGAEQELPLQPGTQDRVSWMVQLAAIVAAQPALRNPGAKIVMHIVGAHGDTSVWTFHCSGRETVQTGLGPVATIKYARESEGGAYDTRAAAWLDAAHHYLPARATMRSGPNDDGFELLLEGVDGAP